MGELVEVLPVEPEFPGDVGLVLIGQKSPQEPRALNERSFLHPLGDRFWHARTVLSLIGEVKSHLFSFALDIGRQCV